MTLLLVLAVIEAVVGFALSEADRRNLGRTPWGIPSAVWALIWFLSLLVGVVLYLIAHRAGVRAAATGPGSVPPPYPMRSTASDFPAYPRPVDRGAGAAPPLPPAPSSVVPPGPSAPPSWQPDPGGRFHYRWWTGTEWTSYVSTGGHVVVDTSPDQRIGPY
jgi:hypothetical protein